jgi:osmoprotectant transport system ATP-binding protein
MNAAAIEFERVTKRFGEGPPALDNVSLAIAPREFVTVVGPSGSGKTTLLRMINRLSEPTAGRVLFGGQNNGTLDPILLRRRIGYVFQEVGLFPHMTVAENIAVTPRLVGWSDERMAARVSELLALVRLDGSFRDRLPHQLSGGQRQRVGLARALAAGPEIMLLDEPFAALDPLTREAIGADYRNLHDELGLTTVMITHDMLEALTLADRIAVITKGQIVADAPPAELIDHQNRYVAKLMEAPRRHAQQIARFFAAGETPG